MLHNKELFEVCASILARPSMVLNDIPKAGITPMAEVMTELVLADAAAIFALFLYMIMFMPFYVCFCFCFCLCLGIPR